VAGSTGRVPECWGEECFPHSDGAQKHHILVSFDETEAEKVPHPVAIEGHRGIPVKFLESLLFLKARTAEPGCQVLLVSPVDLVLQGKFEEVKFTEARFPGIARPVGERGYDAREPQAFQNSLQ